MNYTPQQTKSIQGWTEERDGLLKDIGIYSTELQEIKKSTKQAALDKADIELQIAEARGRLSEIQRYEDSRRLSLPNDIVDLELRKSRLEDECLALETLQTQKEAEYSMVSTATDTLVAANQTMKDQADIVDRVVGEIIQTSGKHTSDMKTMMSDIRAVSEAIIGSSTEVLLKTNSLLESIPKLIVSLQRSLRVRRIYPEGHPKAETKE
jgi:predicted  nucleic acid-binding Zn-ribbon protein